MMRWVLNSSCRAVRYLIFSPADRRRRRGNGPTTRRWPARCMCRSAAAAGSTVTGWRQPSPTVASPTGATVAAQSLCCMRFATDGLGPTRRAPSSTGVAPGGNGAAMRVAPLGAYFAGNLDRAAAQAALSAEVTHRHPEAIVGAMAVAVAAGHAAATRGRDCAPEELLAVVEPYLVEGRTASGVRRARRLLGRSVAEAAYELGNGAQVSAHDTVPFTLWVAATFLDDYPAAVTACVEAGGDADTTAAIVGGIVAARTGIGTRSGVRGIPPQWLSAREPLPAWATDGDARQKVDDRHGSNVR